MSNHPEFPTLLAFDGLEASILVDGKEVPHYGVECNEAKREISCWIESEAGKPFAYRFESIQNEYHSATRTFIDGNCVEHSFLHKELVGGCNSKSWGPRHAVRISPTETRNLAFGSMELTDDDAQLENSSQSLGEIKIIFYKVRSFTNHPNAVLSRKYASPSETHKIHERSKKGLSHHVRYGETVRTEIDKSKACYVDLGGTWATFIFRYRPLAMLQANGIAPLDPILPEPPQEESTPSTPTPSTSLPLQKKRKHSEIKLEVDEDEEQEDIEATERALLEQLEKVRQRKLARNGNSSSKRVKEEPKTYFAPGEIIDLT